MSDVFGDIFNGIKDLIERNPVAGYLTLILFIAAIATMFYYIFNALKSSYLKWMAPLGQTIPFPLLVFLQDELKTAFGSEITVAILLAIAFYILLTNIIYNNLTQIETGKSDSGRFLIIALGMVGLILWAVLISNLFYDFNLPGTETAPPPGEPIR